MPSRVASWKSRRRARPALERYFCARRAGHSVGLYFRICKPAGTTMAKPTRTSAPPFLAVFALTTRWPVALAGGLFRSITSRSPFRTLRARACQASTHQRPRCQAEDGQTHPSTDYSAPLLFVQFGADAEYGKSVVPILCYTLVEFPMSTSIRCPAPKRCPVRYPTQDSAFCATTVPSRTLGRARPDSQLPQLGPREASPSNQVDAPANNRWLTQTYQCIEFADRDALAKHPSRWTRRSVAAAARCRQTIGHPASAGRYRGQRGPVSLVIGLDTLGQSRCATKRTSDLSIPMPKQWLRRSPRRLH